MMTVQPGLELIVILADLTRSSGGWPLDRSDQNLCAEVAAGADGSVLEEAARSGRGERLAGATRARDVSVPAIGDELRRRMAGSADAGYLPAGSSAISERGGRVPGVSVEDTVLTRADGDPAKPTTVAPGMFEFGEPSSAFEARRSAVEESAETEAEIEVEQSRVLHFGQHGRVQRRTRTPNADSIRLSRAQIRQLSSRVVGPPSLVLQAPNFGGLPDDLDREGRRSSWRRQADGRVPGMAGGPRRRRLAREGAERCCPHGDRARTMECASGTRRRRTD
jgi:hypothetical protein